MPCWDENLIKQCFGGARHTVAKKGFRNKECDVAVQMSAYADMDALATIVCATSWQSKLCACGCLMGPADRRSWDHLLFTNAT